jgi:hypothetical protein
VHQGDLLGEVGEEQRLLDGGVAAAQHHHLLAAVEEAVAGGAGRDAEALELLLGGQAQPLGLGAGADDQGLGQPTRRRCRTSAGTGAWTGRLDDDVVDDLGPTWAAWARICSISQGPWMTSAKPG